MKILLTGSAGRIGTTTLPRLLDAGHDVRCFDTLNDFPSHPHGFNEAVEAHLRAQDLDFEWIWGDIRDRDDVRRAVDGVDAVVHFAAMTLPTHCEEAWEYCWDVNHYGTRNVIDAIEASSNQPKLVFASSVAVYGYPPEDGQAFDEDAPLPSTCTYAATKIASELAIRRSRINYTILRIASVLDFSAPELLLSSIPFSHDRLRKEVMLKNPESPAHFVSRDDVNTATLNTLTNPDSDHGIFNVAGPEDCRSTFKDLQDEMRKAFGGQATTDSEWGTSTYPQYYYDISRSDAVLQYAHTGRSAIIENIRASIPEMLDFAQRFPGS